jgi:ribosomal protein L3 glutamine methyltransferase
VNSLEDLVIECRDALERADVHFGHGTDNALDEAAWLVLATAGRPLDGSFNDWKQPVAAEVGERVRVLLHRRLVERLPLAYLLGEAWFCGLPFRVTGEVLVPRSPIAELIPTGFAPWLRDPSGRGFHALDLCTGSGCIAVAMAVYWPAWRVDASDLDPAAVAVARANVQRHGLQDRVEIRRSDLWAAHRGRRYDLVVANPPYVAAKRRAELPAEYRAEPALGLVSGADGLDLPLRLLAAAAAHLTEGGVLICEVGESWEALQTLLPEVPFTWLEFEHAAVEDGAGVFTLDRHQLSSAESRVRALLAERGEPHET